MLRYVTYFEKALYITLLGLLALVLVASVVDLAIVVFSFLTDNSIPLLDHAEILSVFSLFLMVLIGIEFFETILAYLRENIIHVEVIIMVAVIAVARKIIILDTTEGTDLHLIGLSVMMIALGGAYYLVRRSNAQYPIKKKT